jgi:hypothetical protein
MWDSVLTKKAKHTEPQVRFALASFEVLIAVTVKTIIFGDVMPYSSMVDLRK